MREITTHVVNPANDRLKIYATDEPTQGNANHTYLITADGVSCGLTFQNGPINADGNGVNGITHEALLAIILDRLHGFQSGDYKCRENALAITHLEEAVHWLAHRTRARMVRGVEGTHVV